MKCPICGMAMTEYEKRTFNNRCADCYSDVWSAKNIGSKGNKQQVENMIKIFKELRRKEHDVLIKNSYNCAINSYKRQLKEIKKGELHEDKYKDSNAWRTYKRYWKRIEGFGKNSN